jgi:hypothetical protein
MIELEHGDPWLVVAQSPTVEPSTQDHVLPAASADGKLEGIFCISTPNNDQDADRPDPGEKRPPKEPAK